MSTRHRKGRPCDRLGGAALAALLWAAPVLPASGMTAGPDGAGASVMDRSIRVLLLGQQERCRIGATGPFELRDGDSGSRVFRQSGPGRLAVEFRDQAVVFPALSDPPPAARVMDLVPLGGEFVEVEAEPKQWQQYRGFLRLTSEGDGNGTVLNVVDIETYLVGVVAAELPASFHREAFRAQAIAARTYAWYQKRTLGLGRSYDVTATQSSQVYAGLARQRAVPRAAEAVRATRGLVCTWDAPRGEQIFCAYYSSTCGGSTQAAGPVKNRPDIPPLAGNVACTYCRHSPTYRWGPVHLAKSYITQRLRDRYPAFRDLGRIELVEVIDATRSGRPVRFRLTDARGNSRDLRAEDFRLVVNGSEGYLKSTFFVPVAQHNTIVFAQGRGFGHGIGLCQYGADGLAREGWTAGQILRFYYPTSHVVRAY